MSNVEVKTRLRLVVATFLAIVALGNLKGVVPAPTQRLQEIRSSLETLSPKVTPEDTDHPNATKKTDLASNQAVDVMVEGMRDDVWRGFWRSVLLLVLGVGTAATFLYSASVRTLGLCAAISASYVWVWYTLSFGLHAVSISSAIFSRAEFTARLIGLPLSWKSLILIHDNISGVFFMAAAIWALVRIFQTTISTKTSDRH